jgi:hypothetical protein
VTTRFDRSVPPPAPRPQGEGVLAGFDRLKGNLDRATAWAVQGRLRAGQGPDQIRAELPAAAAAQAKTKYPNADRFEESVFAYVQGLVEIELTKQGRND